jgi:hypothetical protein
MDARRGRDMSDCLFCNEDHAPEESCEEYYKEQRPGQVVMPALTSMLDQLIIIAAQSNCPGTCATEEPFKLCNGCIAAAVIVRAGDLLATALDKINEREGD